MLTPRSLLLACGLLATATAPALAPQDAGTEIATLRLETSADGYLAWADNRLAGPIEVRLDATAGPRPQSLPQLPARASVAAGGSVLVARLQTPSGQSGRLQLRLQATPGSSNARPCDVLYGYPLALPDAAVDQGFDGEFSHRDAENRYALDFAVPVGTPVLAARGGIVMQTAAGFHGHGLDFSRDAGRANFIRILHDDGSMALYAHLAEGGVQVRVGQRVNAGQRIGLSGNTGYSSAPHLHFSVQVNRSLQLQSIRFRMRGLSAAVPGAQASASSSEGSTISRHCGSLSSIPTARR